METIQTKALVLKTCNMNDNDKLITFFSVDYGRVTAIAKGVRSHKHKDFSALQQFCYSDVVLNCKQGGLYTVSSAQVINNFFNLRNDVCKVSFASYYMDVVADISQDVTGDDEYFSFVLNTLYLTAIADNKSQEDVTSALKKLKMIFEIKTVCAMGVMPTVTRCICCGKDKGLNYFSSADGGAVCTDCIGRYAGSDKLPHAVNETVLKVINYVVSSDNRKVFNFSVTDELLNVLCTVCENYLISQTDTFYKSLSFLHKLLIGTE